MKTAVSDEIKKTFLEKDLRDALKWLFVGAVTWQATPPTRPECCCHQRALGMFTSLVQARALYEFFYSSSDGDDDARARHFAPSWNEPKSQLYSSYMANWKPVQKRVFHLVYNRSAHSGGTAPDETDHLKNQVLEFAKDLHRLTEMFAQGVEPEFRECVQSALGEALAEAANAAQFCGIDSPFLELGES